MQKSKTLSLISIIVGLLAVITLIVSAFTVTNGPIYNISFVSMMADDIEIARAEAEWAGISHRLLQADAEQRFEFEQLTGVTVEKAAKDLESVSINDIIKYNFLDIFSLSQDETKEFELMRTIIVAYVVLIGIFSLLAALLKCRPLTYIAMTISLPYFIFLAGFVFLFIFLAFSIAHIVLVSRAKIAKKESLVSVAPAM